MIKLDRPKKGERQDLYNDINMLIDAIEELRTQTLGPGLSRAQDGTIFVNTKPQPTTANTSNRPASAGGIVEMHQAWVNTVYSWRLNERVVYMPTGSAWYIVYQCNDATATNTDIPGTSTKWTKVTVWVDEAYWLAATAYTTGNKVLYLGAIYTAAANSTGVVPGTNTAKWTFTADSLIGITSYPLQISAVDTPTPYAEYYVHGIKYDGATPAATTNKLYFGQRKITRYLDGTYKIEPVSDLIEWAPTLDHG